MEYPKREIIERAKHLGTEGQVIAIGATSTTSTQLTAGRWRLSGSGDFWFRQGDSSVVASAAAKSTFVADGQQVVMLVDDVETEGYVAIIQDASSSGNVSLTRIGD